MKNILKRLMNKLTRMRDELPEISTFFQGDNAKAVDKLCKLINSYRIVNQVSELE